MSKRINSLDLFVTQLHNGERNDEVINILRAADDLLEAAEAIMAKYDNAPDGPLGIGLVNGDFFRLRDAINKAKGNNTD